MDEYFGKLFIHVVEARNALAMDVTGTSDPYVILRLEDSDTKLLNQSESEKKPKKRAGTLGKKGKETDDDEEEDSHIEQVQTTIIWKTLNPVWEPMEQFVFNITTPTTTVTIDMWDKDKASSDDFMGRVVLNINSEYPSCMSDEWYPMTGRRGNKKKIRAGKKKKRGDLRLKVQYVKYTKFVDALVEPEFKLVLALSKLLVKDDLAQAFVAIFRETNKSGIVQLASKMIQLEVESDERPETLFRTDSTATKVLKEFSRLAGLMYLHDTLQRTVQFVIENPCNIEVDPNKLSEGQNIEENQKNLIMSVQQFLDNILSSLNDCPCEIRDVCNHLAQEVGKKFPGNEVQAVGGFVFLRFFCPAILTPERYGLVDEPPPPIARRHLLLVTKVLQNIANNVHYGKKEPYMLFMNSFIDKNLAGVSSFLSAMKDTSHETACKLISLPHYISINHLDTVVKYTSQQLDSISSMMDSSDVASIGAEVNLKLLPLIEIRENQLKKFKPRKDNHHRYHRFAHLFHGGKE